MDFINKRLWFIPESPLLKAFWAVFFIGILARFVSFALLPEAAYTDALHHLMLSRDIILQQAFLLPNWILPPPLMHALSASASILAGLSLEFPFVRAIPIIVTVAFLLSCYLLFRKLFGNENFIIPLSFIVVFPWLVRYGTVNYAENLALLLLVFSLYALLRFREAMRAEWLVLLAFLVPAFALTKLNATLLAPLLFILVLVSAFRKKIPLKWIALFAIIAIALSAFWFVSTHNAFGYWSELDASRPVEGAEFQSRGSITPQSLFLSHLSLYDFPPTESFRNIPQLSGLPVVPLQALFFLLTIPLTLAMLWGFFRAMKSPHGRKLHLMLGIMALALIGLSVWNRVNGVLYIRYLIPIIPLAAVFFCRGFVEMKSAKMKSVLALCFAVFAVYSLALTSVSAYYYAKNLEQSNGMIEFVKALPKDTKIFSQESGRAIAFYSGKETG
ncbi:MAG: glycosyltransferase family 39 protein, partial [archaeon]